MLQILIIDDEQGILEILSEFSEMLGYEPIPVRDPSLNNLPCLNENECPAECSCADILLIDQYLPTMFGLDFVENLNRKGCKLSTGPKAIITGILSPQELERAKTLGCDVLLKPITFENFKNWLSSIQDNAA